MTLEERIARLERQNQWMKRCGVAVAAIMGLALLASQRTPDEITARTFWVVNDEGKRWGYFGGEDHPQLRLFEGSGQSVLNSQSLSFTDSSIGYSCWLSSMTLTITDPDRKLLFEAP